MKKYFLLLLLGLLAYTTTAQPDPEATIRLRFHLPQLSFSKGISNYLLQVVKGKVYRQNGLIGRTYFGRNDIDRQDTVNFEVRTFGAIDTLILDIVNRQTAETMRLILLNIGIYERGQIDLPTFNPGNYLLDINEIKTCRKAPSNNSPFCQNCSILDSAKSTHYFRAQIQSLRPLYFDVRKIPTAHLSFAQHLDVANYFSIHEGLVIKSFLEMETTPLRKKGNKKIVGHYDFCLDKKRRNFFQRLFRPQHVGDIYAGQLILYDDFTFFMDLLNAPFGFPETQSYSIGIWETQAGILRLDSPVNWLPFFQQLAVEYHWIRGWEMIPKKNVLTEVPKGAVEELNLLIKKRKN